MTLHDLHTRAILPAQFTVCGIELMPLTVGHARILDALGLWGAEKPDELILAAVLCSGTSSTFERRLASWWFPTALRIWKWRLGKRWDYEASKAAWQAFVNYHRDEPATINKRKATPTLVPLMACVRSALCGAMGYRPETFDEQRLAQVMIDFATVQEMDGSVRSLPLSVNGVRERYGVRN